MPPDVVTTPIDIETTNSPLPDTLSKPTDNSLNGLEPLINGQEQLEVGVTNRWLIPTMSVAGGVALGYLGNEVTMVGASEMGMAFTEGAGIDMLGFVGGTLAEAGKTRPEITDANGKTRMPTAHELADPNVHIPGLSDPKPLSEAKPNDVIAQEHGDTWGHSGIVVGPGQTVSANANEGGTVTQNDWGFRTAGQNGESSRDPAPVVRHPEDRQ